MSPGVSAMKDSVVQDGFQRSVNAEEKSTDASSKPTILASPRMNDATSVERAVLCGLSEKDAIRLDRVRNGVRAGSFTQHIEDVDFMMDVIDKLIEIHRPKYTYEDIVEMHSHLG